MRGFKLRLIIVVFGVLFGTVESSGGDKNKAKDSLTVDADPNEVQKISILVGKSSDLDPLAEGDPEEGNEGELDVESTAFEWCRENRCCYQFTWVGYVQEIPSDPANATCEYHKTVKKYDDMACFDPIVYTVAEEGSSARGRGPNITRLHQDAEANNWNIFCPLTEDKSCLTLKFFSKGGGNQVVNETRFCGSVTEVISGSRKTSGCYDQDISGYKRQVCVCRNQSYCNSGIKLQGVFFGSLILIAILINSLF